MPAADLLTPNEQTVSIYGKGPKGQWLASAFLAATVGPPITIIFLGLRYVFDTVVYYILLFYICLMTSYTFKVLN